jgi:signal peptidase II (EC:3.4.23.36). Aspartic peptidase. MEROPS family A08
MRARFRFGLLLAALVLAADQLSKWWILQIVELDRVGQIVVTPFLNLTMVWNRGITFGLLGSDLWWKPLLLGALALAIAGLLVRWLARAESGRVAWGLGLVLGGAVGNVIDRARFGAWSISSTCTPQAITGMCSTWPTVRSSAGSACCCWMP